ncbi:virulence-associated protein E, partial [bacterium LRH843]|nr:virulence-associated protein E [bacterium LRH843]
GWNGPLIVAEGIETTLSLPAMHNADEARYWSALSAGGIKALQLSKQPDQLILAADGDSVGLQAATDLGERAVRYGWDVTLMQAPAG